MREELQKIDGIRKNFTAIFERLGWKTGYKEDVQTVLLKNVKDTDGLIVAEHLWFNFTKGFQEANLNEGDVVSFCARVKEYSKGYKGRRDDVYKPIEIDYKLSHPSKVVKVSK